MIPLASLFRDVVDAASRRPAQAFVPPSGTYAIDLDPLSLLCRLAAAVPPPRLHTVRYSGVLATACKWRWQIIPPPKVPPPESKTAAPARGPPFARSRVQRRQAPEIVDREPDLFSM